MGRRGRQVSLPLALDSVVKRLDRKSQGGYTAAKVVSAWEKIAAGILSSHTTGTHLRDGVLVVYVDGNSWATHFTAEAERYRAAINRELGQELVQAVKFVVSKRVSAEQRLKRAEEDTLNFYGADEVAPLPLSETELLQVKASVADIPDEELRQAVYRATVKDLEWKKGLASQNGPQATPEGL